jgi:serpin B
MPCRRYIPVRAFCLLVLIICLGTGWKPDGNRPVPDLSDRINRFTFDILHQHAREEGIPANAILSPQSIFHGMAMTYVASQGRTRRELTGAFHFPDSDEQLMRDLASLRGRLQRSARGRRVDMEMANAVWVDDTEANFREDYLRKLRDAFAGAVRRGSFKDGKVAGQVNGWVARKTRGRIKNIVAPGDFLPAKGGSEDDAPGLVCVNAIYFKSDWASAFTEGETRSHAFHTGPDAAGHAMLMHQRSMLKYAKDEHFQFLEIPYLGEDYCLQALLPVEVLPIQELLSQATPDALSNLSRQAVRQEVDVLLPTFELRTRVGLKGLLGRLGAESVFDSRRAELGRMIHARPDAERVYMGSMWQDAWIRLDEKGTEAAAATTSISFPLGCSAESISMPVSFHADHPFLFFIVHRPSQSLLFAGWITDPEQGARQGTPSP